MFKQKWYQGKTNKQAVIHVNSKGLFFEWSKLIRPIKIKLWAILNIISQCKSSFRNIFISANLVYKKKIKETANLEIFQPFYHSPCENTSALQNKLFYLLKISKAYSKSKTASGIQPGFYWLYLEHVCILSCALFHLFLAFKREKKHLYKTSEATDIWPVESERDVPGSGTLQH